MSKHKIKLTLLLLACMLFASMTPAAAFDAAEQDHHKVNLTVCQTVEDVNGTKPIFTYLIIPMDDNSEMPENGNELSLSGTENGSWIFDLEDLIVGEELHYQIVQQGSSSDDFSRDDSVYELEIIGLQGDEGVYPQMILTEDGQKFETVAYSSRFIGEYDEETDPDALKDPSELQQAQPISNPTSPASKDASQNKNTGIVSDTMTIAALAGAAVIAGLFIILYKKESRA